MADIQKLWPFFFVYLSPLLPVGVWLLAQQYGRTHRLSRSAGTWLKATLERLNLDLRVTNESLDEVRPDMLSVKKNGGNASLVAWWDVANALAKTLSRRKTGLPEVVLRRLLHASSIGFPLLLMNAWWRSADAENVARVLVWVGLAGALVAMLKNLWLTWKTNSLLQQDPNLTTNQRRVFRRRAILEALLTPVRLVRPTVLLVYFNDLAQIEMPLVRGELSFWFKPIAVLLGLRLVWLLVRLLTARQSVPDENEDRRVKGLRIFGKLLGATSGMAWGVPTLDMAYLFFDQEMSVVAMAASALVVSSALGGVSALLMLMAYPIVGLLLLLVLYILPWTPKQAEPGDEAEDPLEYSDAPPTRFGTVLTFTNWAFVPMWLLYLWHVMG